MSFSQYSLLASSSLYAICVTADASEQPRRPKPNMVFVLTDDQDTRLGDSQNYTEWGTVDGLPIAKRVRDSGAAMTNFFVNTPICCPSRTEFFTGRYFHNVKVAHGSGCMFANITGTADPLSSLYGVFTANGYQTGIFGKTTNDARVTLPALVARKAATYIDSPIDFDNFNGLPYFRYDASKDESKWHTEVLDPQHPRFDTTYQTTQIGNRSLIWLNQILQNDPETTPFFMYLGPHAPHVPSTPAPWYEDAFPELNAPHTPNYNVSSPNKVQHIRQNPPISEEMECWENQHMRDRWRSLLSVDDMIEGVTKALAEKDVLKDSYIVYTSDHGYHLGQWRLVDSKMHPYETDIRVPFFISGPGIAAKSVFPQVVGNTDLLPTLVELAGLPAVPGEIDGKSFASILAPSFFTESTQQLQHQWRQSYLSEYHSLPGNILGNYFKSVWATNETTAACGGPTPSGPAGKFPISECHFDVNATGEGNCYIINSGKTGSFRALRTINETHDTQYIEWHANGLVGHVILREYYDISTDVYQMNNLYDKLSSMQQQALASELHVYSTCRGSTCP